MLFSPRSGGNGHRSLQRRFCLEGSDHGRTIYTLTILSSVATNDARPPIELVTGVCLTITLSRHQRSRAVADTLVATHGRARLRSIAQADSRWPCGTVLGFEGGCCSAPGVPERRRVGCASHPAHGVSVELSLRTGSRRAPRRGAGE